MRKTLLLLLIIFTITSFRTNNTKYYKYRYVMEVFKDGKSAVLMSHDYISYEDYIIEFITKDFITNHVSNDDTTISTTITKPHRVNFIHLSSQTFFSIDTFSTKSKKIKQGPLHQKELGMIFSDTAATTTAQTDYNSADGKDTIVNNIAHLYYSDTIKDQHGADSIFCKILFLKKTDINLISHTGINRLLDNKYPFAGAIFFTKDGREGTAIYIKDLMPLSVEEERRVKDILTVHTKKSR